MNNINVTAMTFAGLKLDVITGHPDHELLFIGKQVLDAAGLLNGSNALWRYKATLCLSDMPAHVTQTLVDYPRVQYKSKLIDEATVYKILLRGHAPAAEPFRKWITEEVLPTIRKTGSYNIETSTTPEAAQFAGEFAAMRLMLDDLREEVAGLKQTILEWKIPTPMQVIAKSPYEGQAKANVFHSLTAKQYNECAENLNVSRLVSDKLKGSVLIELNRVFMKEWDKTHNSALTSTTSAQGRVWHDFPADFMRRMMQNTHIREAIQTVMMQRLANMA